MHRKNKEVLTKYRFISIPSSFYLLRPAPMALGKLA